MEIYNQITSNYLKGKSIYPEIRRIIAFLLKLSISTYAYVFFFGKFDVYQVMDYQKIIYFFLSGHFFIPFSVFALTHITFILLSSLIFHALTFYPVIKLKKKIIEYKLTSEDKETGKDVIKSIAKYSIKKDVSDDELRKVYYEYREKYLDNFNTKKNEELEKDFLVEKKNVELNFNFTFLILISSILFYVNLPDFYTALFVIVLFITLVFSIFSIITYRFFDILPTILVKIPEILKEHEKTKEKTEINEI